MLIPMTTITFTEAVKRTEAGLTKAHEMGVAMNVAVVDPAGHLVYFARMEGAWLGSIDIALKKAKTSALFPLPSAAIGAMSQPGGPIYGIEHSNDGLITFGGGLPLTDEAGNVIGAVGVSGGMVDQDVAVAAAIAG